MIHSFNTGNILYNLFSGNSSHSDCHSSNIYLFVRDFRSENGMRSTEMSPSRASLAAESGNPSEQQRVTVCSAGVRHLTTPRPENLVKCCRSCKSVRFQGPSPNPCRCPVKFFKFVGAMLCF